MTPHDSSFPSMATTAAPSLEIVEQDPRTDRKVQSSAKYAYAVTSLLERHPTMRGVSLLADHVDESVRWAI